MKRLHSIDILRTTAIILMVQVHFVNYLSDGRNTALYDLANGLGSIPAPLFTFLVGVSLFISLSKYDAKTARTHTLKRGIAIFIIGLLHYLINWGAAYLFDWDILTLIGSALILVYFLRHLRWSDMLLVIFGVIIISPPLREATGYNLHWNFSADEYRYAFTLKDIFLGWLLHGFFPILPWIIFPLAGYASGRAIFNAKTDQTQRARARNLGLVGGLALLCAATNLGLISFFPKILDSALHAYISPSSFYPASTTYLLLTLGISLLSFAALWLLLDDPAQEKRRKKWEQSIFSAPIQRFSRYSLTIYILHHTVHLYPLYLVGYLVAHDRWYYYANALSVSTALLLAALFIVAFHFISRSWDKIGGRYSLEWLLGYFVKG